MQRAEKWGPLIPPPPHLFGLVVDTFTRMLIKTAKKKYIADFMTSLYPEGVISLQYGDDTLLFLKHDYKVGWHLKWVMICFEQISAMKIKYNKSSMTPVNLEEEEIQ
jgi:hypothetical protein